MTGHHDTFADYEEFIYVNTKMTLEEARSFARQGWNKGIDKYEALRQAREARYNRYTVVKETTERTPDGLNAVKELERLKSFTDEIQARINAIERNQANTEEGIFYSLSVEPIENGEPCGEWHIESEDL